MFVNKSNLDVTVPVYFGATALSGMLTSELPEDLFDVDERCALATLAALITSPDVRDGERYLVSMETLALRQLALFAAGADVFYTKADYRSLDRDAARCANDENHELVSWVRRAAYERAKCLSITGPESSADLMARRTRNLQRIELVTGRGYGDLAGSLEDALFEDRPQVRETWTSKRLVTYAAVMAACRPRRCTQDIESVIMLALYGAGTRIRLTSEQFQTLRLRAEYYISRVREPRFPRRNLAMAEFVLQVALERADEEGIS